MRINEIFFSIQGESTSAGLPTVFVRTTGCNLRCRYCDTQYAYYSGEEMTPLEVFREVSKHPGRRVCLTGGEPLMQDLSELQDLMDMLSGYEVSIETNGTLSISGLRLSSGHRWIMDIKCPSSGHAGHIHPDNLALLRRQDEVKFVIGDRDDYLTALRLIQREGLQQRCRVLLSPVYQALQPALLAEWVLADGLDCRIQLQLHKYIWGEKRGV